MRVVYLRAGDKRVGRRASDYQPTVGVHNIVPERDEAVEPTVECLCWIGVTVAGRIDGHPLLICKRAVHARTPREEWQLVVRSFYIATRWSSRGEAATHAKNHGSTVFEPPGKYGNPPGSAGSFCHNARRNALCLSRRAPPSALHYQAGCSLSNSREWGNASVVSYGVVVPDVIAFKNSVVDERVAEVGVDTRVAPCPGRQPTSALELILGSHDTKGLRVYIEVTRSRCAEGVGNRVRCGEKAAAAVEF